MAAPGARRKRVFRDETMTVAAAPLRPAHAAARTPGIGALPALPAILAPETAGSRAAMSEPRTLLSLAGAPPVRARPAEAALVLVDLQGEYRDGALKLPGIDAAAAEAAALLATARETGMPVIHIQHRGRAGGAFDPTGPHFALLPPVAPLPGEEVEEKGLPNSFAGTGLATRLEVLGRKEILLAGAMTHMCISSTARAALDLGLKVAIVASACATRDLPDPLGGPALPAAALHRASLTALADRFATIYSDAAAWHDGIG